MLDKKQLLVELERLTPQFHEAIQHIIEFEPHTNLGMALWNCGQSMLVAKNLLEKELKDNG